MASTDSLTEWDDLSSKRRVVLKTAQREFGEETFACGELNRHLSEPTTTTTLNNLWEEDGYLRKWTGGSSMLLALLPDEEDKAAFGPAQEEDLAVRMIRREGLSLDARKVDWADNDERENFQEEFNARSTEVELQATWTRNKYQVREEADTVIRRN